LTKYKFYVLIKTKQEFDERGQSNMAKLMDIDDLAGYLRLKKQTIYNWLHQGKISGMKVGGVWRFEHKEVDNWLKSKRRLSKEQKSGEKQ
jgi:excisionase family DNA binding protein